MSLYAKPCPFFITFCHRDIFSTALKSPSVFVYTLYCKSNNKTIAAPAQSANSRTRADWNVPTACNKFQTGFTPNKEERLLALPLLRTVRESFPSYRSSLS